MNIVIGKNLGVFEPETEVAIDLATLIESRMLVTANSGAGKSYALRRIIEQSSGHVQQIILDREDEYFTLREKFDYILARERGDCPVQISSAKMLARRIMELGVSAVVNLYELPAHDRALFVQLFCEGLMEISKKSYRPVLLVIDEAHQFAPEDERACSTTILNEIASGGRKRGIALVAATQRLSKFHKDAAAELKNRMVGNVTLDVDTKRASEELGFSTRSDRAQLRHLATGEWFLYGPAVRSGANLAATRDIVRLKTGAVSTQHPQIGQQLRPPRPPSDRVKEVLGALAAIPIEAAAETATLETLRRAVAEKDAEIERLHAASPAIDGATAEGYREEGRQEQLRDIAGNIDRTFAPRIAELWREICAEPIAAAIAKFGASVNATVDALFDGLPTAAAPSTIGSPPIRVDRAASATEVDVWDSNGQTAKAFSSPASENGREDGSPLGKLERAMLTVLAQHPHGLSQQQILLHSGYAASGHVSTAMAMFRRAGYIEKIGGSWRLTQGGLAAVGPVRPAPTGRALLAALLQGDKLAREERALLKVIAEGGGPMAKKDIVAASGYKPSGHISTAFARLKRYGYIAISSGRVGLAQELR